MRSPGSFIVDGEGRTAARFGHFFLPFVLLMGPSACPDPEDTSQKPQETGDSSETGQPADTDTTDTVDTGLPPETGDTGTAPLPDLSATGPYTVDVETDYAATVGSCTTIVDEFHPRGAPADAPHVVLAHGFSRYGDVLDNLAAHYASWGIEVATMTLCHIYVLSNDPQQDAEDLNALSDRLGGGPVLYVGHSVGGMRSVLAGINDTDTVAVLGLDLVDYEEIGVTAVPALGVPLYGVHGESTECNDSDVGLDVYAAAAQSDVVRAAEADHCDFEDPTDWMCTSMCSADNLRFTETEVRATIRALSTAFLLWQSGIDPVGQMWWTPGSEPYESMIAEGSIEQL